MRIRRAALSDIPAMAQLLAELFTIEDDFAIDSEKQIHGLHLLLQNPDAVVFIADKENCVIGMITLQSLISTVMGKQVGVIEDVIVTRDFRGEGIGSSLLRTAIEESKRLGYPRLALGADSRNERAIAFYRKHGFKTGHMGLMYRS